jgi:D-alanine-D-alanine ligase
MKNVGIFCGGFSSEFDISVKSATTIFNHLNRSMYQPYLILVRREGWFASMDEREFLVSMADFSFDIDGQRIQLDIGHVYIHGNPGENGKLQAYFEMKEFPYVNSNALTSALSFDKWFCNQFLKSFGIPVAKSILLRQPSDRSAAAIVKELGLPVFVKPADSGSSYGISKVYEENKLDAAIASAFAEGRTVVIEAFMQGVEVTCGVYRNETGSIALPCTEIVTDRDFFDFEAKYMGESQEITPARISDEMTAKVQSLAKQIYELLQLRSIARIDFIIIGEEPHVIEVNTTPGFSGESIVPKMLQSAGITIADFWEEIYNVELSSL